MWSPSARGVHRSCQRAELWVMPCFPDFRVLSWVFKSSLWVLKSKTWVFKSHRCVFMSTPVSSNLPPGSSGPSPWFLKPFPGPQVHPWVRRSPLWVLKSSPWFSGPSPSLQVPPWVLQPTPRSSLPCPRFEIRTSVPRTRGVDVLCQSF